MIRARVRRGQDGLASIVVVSILIVLLTLISLGFAKIMSRSATNSTNRQLSSSANYAAQSVINDVVAYMRDYAVDPANDANPWVKSDNCQDLIKTPSGNGPFSKDVNIGQNTKVNCILLNPTPYELLYTSVGELKSQVTKISTSAFNSSLDSAMISWQASDPTRNNPATSCCNLPDEITWNSPPNNFMPLLRVTLYPVPLNKSKASMDYLQSHSRTWFLYPNPAVGSSTGSIDYTSPSVSSGKIVSVHCNGPGSTDPSFVGAADYKCNIIVKNLKNSVDPGDQLDYMYARLTPIYGPVDIKVKANDYFGQKLKFIGSQAIVDVTATTSNVSKRLQARVDISGIRSNGTNASSNDNNLPEDSLRSATALCKRVVLHRSFFDYVSLEDPGNICASPVATPAPSLTFSITGLDDLDNGVTVGSSQASPRNGAPAYNGTVFVGTNDRLNWQAKDATQCTASSPTDSGWNGYNVLGSSTFSGSTASGNLNRTFAAPTPTTSTIQTYTLSCSGPGGGPVTATVKAWPPPKVKLTSFGDVYAGDNITVNWNVADATGCTFSGDWADKSPSPPYDGTAQSGSRNTPTSAGDAGTSKSFTITCTDPAGRSATDPITVNIIAPPPPPPGGGNEGCVRSGGDATGYPDPCVRTATFDGWSGNVINIKIFASHCYRGLSVSPGSLSGGWIASPSDNSDLYPYQVFNFPSSGGTLTITCLGGNTSYALYDLSIPPAGPPPPPACPPDCPPPPPPPPPSAQTIYGCDWGDGNYDADISSNFCWVNGGTWGAFCDYGNGIITRGGCP